IEFYTVLSQMAEHCITALGTHKALEIKPFSNKTELLNSLQLTNDYLASLYNDNRIPNHSFEPITKELQYLKIENTFLETTSLKKIVSISMTCNEIIKFLKKFEVYYPNLYQFSASIEITKVIIDAIDVVVDRFGDVKDKASDTLHQLRLDINIVKGKINQSFNSAINSYSNLDYLDD